MRIRIPTLVCSAKMRVCNERTVVSMRIHIGCIAGKNKNFLNIYSFLAKPKILPTLQQKVGTLTFHKNKEAHMFEYVLNLLNRRIFPSDAVQFKNYSSERVVKLFSSKVETNSMCHFIVYRTVDKDEKLIADFSKHTNAHTNICRRLFFTVYALR